MRESSKRGQKANPDTPADPTHSLVFLNREQVSGYLAFCPLYFLMEALNKKDLGSCLKKGQHSIFLIIHLFLPIKYFFFLFRISDTVSDIWSVLLNFIANYDSKNENIPPYCL